MRVGFNTVRSNPSFGVVDIDFLLKAKRCYDHWGNVTANWMMSIGDAVAYKALSKKDAADTLAIVRERYVPKRNVDVYDEFVRQVIS